jgi:predicted Zn-ribbon and HTH transcriptional regulator
VAPCRAVSGTADPSEKPGAAPVRCPRCGGVSRPHPRYNARNPFLSKPATEVTCEDCGLDFEPAAVSEPSRPSGKAPWSKP